MAYNRSSVISASDFIIFSASYSLATMFLSPDLDLHTSKPTQNWRALRYFWRPYSILFKHRGFSHSIVLGPLTRILYILCALTVLIAIYQAINNIFFGIQPSISNTLSNIHLEATKRLIEENQKDIFLILLGIWLSDFVHIAIGDHLYGFIKKLIL